MHGQRVVALGTGTDVLDVRLSTRPPHTVHLVARVAGGLRFFQRRRIHHTPAPQQHIVRLGLTHLQPGRFLLHAGCGHRQQLQLETVHLGALLQQRDRLFAKRTVVVDQRNLLALEFVHAAQALANVLDQDVGAGPVAAQQGEVPLEGHAVLRDRQAVANGQQGNLVARCFFGQGKGDAGALRVNHGDAGAALQTLVAFHAAVGCIGGFAFLEGNLHAVDAAIACVDHLEIVLLAVSPWDAVRGIGASAVGQ